MPINRAIGRRDRFPDLAGRPVLFTASESVQNGSRLVGGWKTAAEVRAIRRSFSSRAARVQKIVSKLLESFIETSPRSRIHERACGEGEELKDEAGVKRGRKRVEDKEEGRDDERRDESRGE